MRDHAVDGDDDDNDDTPLSLHGGHAQGRQRQQPSVNDGNTPSIGVICLYRPQAWLISKLMAEAGMLPGVNKESGGVGKGGNGPQAQGIPRENIERSNTAATANELKVSTVDAFQVSWHVTYARMCVHTMY